MSEKIKQKKGFTIIEVVLVLAIAGLIFLMVFYVVPQAMAGQRDGERRQAMSRVQAALVQYQTNNKSKRNNLPDAGSFNAQAAIDAGTEYPESCDSACKFVKNYMNSGADENTNTFYDPDGVPYNVVITDNMYEKKGIISGSMTVGAATAKLSATGSGSGEKTEYTVDGTDAFKAHTVFIVPGGECSGENVKKSELRHFAVLYRLENASVYCGDSD
jgi:prepilin-type N-terminal cleavage/methylation domain-containing protein